MWHSGKKGIWRADVIRTYHCFQFEENKPAGKESFTSFESYTQLMVKVATNQESHCSSGVIFFVSLMLKDIASFRNYMNSITEHLGKTCVILYTNILFLLHLSFWPTLA